MKNELIEYHRKAEATSRKRSYDAPTIGFMRLHQEEAQFHERAVAWLESLPQSDSPSDAAVTALEKASAWMKP